MVDYVKKIDRFEPERLDRQINALVMAINALMSRLANLPVYADNAAALAGGLMVGEYYRIGDVVAVVH
jgi:predicted component of type VI protein secretion system